MSNCSSRLQVRISLAVAAAALLAACQPAEGPSEAPPALSPEQLRSEAQTFLGRSASVLASDEDAMALAAQLFDAHCASCHAPGAEGRGVMDLRHGTFNYGSTEDAVRTTISQGRISVMPDMGHSLGEVDLGQLVAFVQSLSFEASLSSYAERGKLLFAANCAKCHGPEGQGDTALGAPNLADGYWQHGDSMMNIRLVITRGTEAECPGFGDAPTPAETELLTAYVLELNGDTDAR